MRGGVGCSAVQCGAGAERAVLRSGESEAAASESAALELGSTQPREVRPARVKLGFRCETAASAVEAPVRSAAMAGAMAASLQHRTVAPCFLLSTPSSSSSSPCSTSPYVRLCAHHAWQSRSPCVTQRLPASSWTPAVARVAFPGVAAAAAADDDEEEGALSLYEEGLGLEEEANKHGQSVASTGANLVKRTFRLLGNKEKKELRAYAHQLGNDVCIHQVGKWGLTTNCITAISDALEANELVKIRVLDNLDEELRDTASQLEAKTGAQIVGKMGRTLLLYRPSMRKLKAAQAAEEKAYKYQKRKNLLASRTKSSRSIPGASRGKR